MSVDNKNVNWHHLKNRVTKAPQQDTDHGNDRLFQLLKQNEALIQQLKASRSWQLTAPFRFVGGVLRKLLLRSSTEPAFDTSAQRNYSQWIRQFDSADLLSRNVIHEQIECLPNKPLFSILLVVRADDLLDLDASIRSIQQQAYSEWELCIAVSGEMHDEVQNIVKAYPDIESKIKIASCLSDDLAALSHEALVQTSVNSLWALKVKPGVVMASNTLYKFAQVTNVQRKCQIIYADEDVIDEQRQRSEPNFKPDWNIDLHLSRSLMGSCSATRTELLRQAGGYQSLAVDVLRDVSKIVANESRETTNDLDLDTSLRCIELIDQQFIVHVPFVLFHKPVKDTVLPHATTAGVASLNRHFVRQGIQAHAENLGYGYRIHYALPTSLPLVTLIIPTRNGLALLRQCINSIQQKTSYLNYEVIIIDNGSDDPLALEYFEQLRAIPNIRMLRIDAPFNYAALNNAAVKIANGELICLLNNDVEVISPDWLNEMVSHALRPGVGAVGARLWFPDDTLQHGGVVLGMGGVAGHAHLGLESHATGYHGRAALTQSLSAVTAACLLMKKSVFERVGGFNSKDLAVAFNDIDLCLRVKEAGFRHVWTPFAELYHHESASRGYEDTPEKQLRFSKEATYMYQRWGHMLQNDPAYNPNLTLDAQDFGLAWPPRTQLIDHQVALQPSQPPLYERLATLAKGKVRVVYFVENVHSSTFRYRAANMVQVLNHEGDKQDCLKTSASCFFTSDLKYADEIVDQADILVVSRARYDSVTAQLINAFQTQGKRVWFDIDDLVFGVNHIDQIISSSGQVPSDDVLNYWFGVVGRMSQTLRLCDAVITTNAFLANKIEQLTGKSVKIIPNFANAAQYEVSAPLYEQKLKSVAVANKRVKLGYFSGSASHNADLALIAGALERLMMADARIDLVLVGHVDIEHAFGARFGGYLKGHLADRLMLHPFVDFVALQTLIADVDFNLVPLVLNDFTHCKSELKFVDAAMVGTLTIASPSFAYVEAIRHGENGYLAEDGQWEVVLLHAIAIRDHDFERHKRMMVAANHEVQRRFTWKTQRPSILQALEIS